MSGGDRAAPERLRVLALAGSLRGRSTNRSLLHAARVLAPQRLEIVVYDRLADLPSFNPDDEDALPAPVRAWRADVGASAGLLIACPEYAHGVPGAFKNALDWLVGGHEFPNKPVVLFNASPRASHAQAALREILVTMSGRLVEEASLALPLLGRDLDAAAIVADTALAEPVRAALRCYADALDGILAAGADAAAAWG